MCGVRPAAGDVLQILALSGLVSSVSYIPATIIYSAGRADLSFRISLLGTGLRIVLCLLVVQFGIKAVAVVNIIVPLCTLPISLYFMRKMVSITIRDLAMELVPATVSTAIMSASVTATHLVLTGRISSGAELGALIAVGVVTYGATLFVTARPSLVQILHGFPR